ncbi:unnamed protein product [Adineta ricciae]|uniref:Tc1-like transposase DDE domain-containing protein n=1 Tax=Adineta ricciae TaxID=249248 RepID=A0A815WVR1_ADIRI|nr:unnamed protein product [Adineta ricciae]CAF1673270.1 unnamed protein product [Adineta ricciae]
MEFCRYSFERFEEGRSRRVYDIITGDESWFYHFDPETKEQSKVWVSKTDQRPTKVRRNRSSGKRMVAFFFMKSGLIKSVTLESDQNITAAWYVNHCLPQLFEAVSQRRKKSALRNLILHDDNARPHRAWTTTEFLTQNSVESYQNPPYSPDLSPCDFFLFPRLKKQVRGIQFVDDNSMLPALDQAIGSLTADDFKNCFKDSFVRKEKCIDVQGQYFEKIN